MKLFFKLLFIGLMFVLITFKPLRAQGIIQVDEQATFTETYAARELQRYIYQLTGTCLPIKTDTRLTGQPAFILGHNRAKVIQTMIQSGKINLTNNHPGPQGYVLKTLSLAGQPSIVIGASDSLGVLYGVYGLLEDHFNMGFYLGGDVFPPEKSTFEWPDVNETKSPTMSIRGFLPWTNFPQSATVYSWEDWTFIIDQMAKMRMNFLHIHNYNGQFGHNEMYHNFELNGYMSRVWMPTARTGHAWRCPGWDVNAYLFGASGLFDDYDFGADCALHNKSLTNRQVFAKSSSLFRKVIDYAHSRGIKIGLGIDIDLIPADYAAQPDEADVVDVRIEQITSDYPTLDYLLCFQSELAIRNATEDQVEQFYHDWRVNFMRYYTGIKNKSVDTRLAVAGWGLEPEAIAPLPEDVICAPISRYSDTCESGKIYGDREFWGCPWLERDFNSSGYYYPYNMDLSNTIRAYQNRADNMNGFYCLTWRLTDAIDPKMSYIAKVPWYSEQVYSTSIDVYYEYAVKNYGKSAAEKITPIINQNEPFACDFGECKPTPRIQIVNESADRSLLDIKSIRLIRPDAQSKIDLGTHSGKHEIEVQKNDKDKHLITNINAGDWIRYNDIDFGKGTSVVEIELFYHSQNASFEMILDQMNGPTVGHFNVDYAPGSEWRTRRFYIDTVSGVHDIFFKFKDNIPNDLQKANQQVEIINDQIKATIHPEQRHRLGLLWHRLAATRDHILLNQQFPDITWKELPGAFASWVEHFTHRVTDISSLGNIISVQNRFIQQRYLSKVISLRQEQHIRPPADLVAKGTRTGAIITWKNQQQGATGFYVYRDNKKLNNIPLSPDTRYYVDINDKDCMYTVSVLNRFGLESKPSIPARCHAGQSDNHPPFLVLISPPGSMPQDQDASVKIRVLDNRVDSLIHAKLYTRTLGTTHWTEQSMHRKTKAIFTAEIAADVLINKGAEYYVRVTDGDNLSFFPASGPDRPLSIIVYPVKDDEAPPLPANFSVQHQTLTWSPASTDVYGYQIYRDREKDFKPGLNTLLTYTCKNTFRFQDKEPDFDGKALKGRYYYKIIAVDKTGNKSPSSVAIGIEYSSF